MSLISKFEFVNGKYKTVIKFECSVLTQFGECISVTNTDTNNYCYYHFEF